MSRRQPAAQRIAALLFVIEKAPDLTVTEIAASTGMSVALTAKYVDELERQRRVVARRETKEEAAQRYWATPRSTLTRRHVRRQLRWSLAVAMERAA